MSWKDNFKKLFNQAVDAIPEAGTGTVIVTQPAQPATAPASFSEEDVKKREQAAAEVAAKKARDEAEASFAEQRKIWEAEAAAKTRKAELKAKFDGLVQQGKVAPAWMKAGIVEFAEQLDGNETVEFGESGKQTPSEWFLAFVEGLPKLVNLSEVAGRDKDTGKGGAGEKLGAIIRKKTESGKSYGEAFAEAQMENIDLAREYAESLRQE